MIKINSNLNGRINAVFKTFVAMAFMLLATFVSTAQIVPGTPSPFEDVIEYCTTGGAGQNQTFTAPVNSNSCTTSTGVQFQWWQINNGVWTNLGVDLAGVYNSANASTFNVEDMVTFFAAGDSITCVWTVQPGSCNLKDTSRFWTARGISSVPTVTITADQDICEGSLVSWTGSVTAPTPIGNFETYWGRFADSGFVAQQLDTVANQNPTYTDTYSYTGTLFDDKDSILFSASNVCGESDTVVSYLTVFPVPTGEVVIGDTSFCPVGATGTATLSYSVTNALTDTLPFGVALDWTTAFNVVATTEGDAASVAAIQAYFDANNTGTGNDTITLDVLSATEPTNGWTPGVYEVTYQTVTLDTSINCSSTINGTFEIVISPRPRFYLSYGDSVELRNDSTFCEGTPGSFNIIVDHATADTSATWTYRLVYREAIVSDTCARFPEDTLIVTGTGNQTVSVDFDTLLPGFYVWRTDSFYSDAGCGDTMLMNNTNERRIRAYVLPNPEVVLSKTSSSVCPGFEDSFTLAITNTQYCDGFGPGNLQTATYEVWYTDATNSDIGTVVGASGSSFTSAGDTFTIVTNDGGTLAANASYDLTIDSVKLAGLAYTCVQGPFDYDLSVADQPTIDDIRVTDSTVCEDNDLERIEIDVTAPLGFNWQIYYSFEGRSVDSSNCAQNINPGVLPQSPISGTSSSNLTYSINNDVPVGMYKYTFDSIKFLGSTCQAPFIGDSAVFQVDPIARVSFSDDTSFCEDASGGNFRMFIDNNEQCAAYDADGTVDFSSTFNFTQSPSVTTTLVGITGTTPAYSGNDTIIYTIGTPQEGVNTFAITGTSQTTTAGGCTGSLSETYTITVNSVPEVQFTTPFRSQCGTQPVTNLTASNNATNDDWTLWYTETSALVTDNCEDTGHLADVLGGGASQQLTRNDNGGFGVTAGSFMGTGIYTVKLDSIKTGDCVGTLGVNDSLTFIMIPAPQATLTPVTDTICEDEEGEMVIEVSNTAWCDSIGSDSVISWSVAYDNNYVAAVNGATTLVAGATGGNFTGSGDSTVVFTTNTVSAGGVAFEADSVKNFGFDLVSVSSTTIAPCSSFPNATYTLEVFNAPNAVKLTDPSSPQCEDNWSASSSLDDINIAISNAEQDTSVADGGFPGDFRYYDWEFYYTDSVSLATEDTCQKVEYVGDIFASFSSADAGTIAEATGSNVITGNGNHDNLELNIRTDLAPGLYTITFDSIKNVTQGVMCSSSTFIPFTVEFEVVAIPELFIASASQDTVCEDETTTFDVAARNATRCLTHNSIPTDIVTDIIGNDDDYIDNGSGGLSAVNNTVTTISGYDTIQLTTLPLAGEATYIYSINELSSTLCSDNDNDATDNVYTLVVQPKPDVEFTTNEINICEGDNANATINVSDASFGGVDIDWVVYTSETAYRVLDSCVVGDRMVFPDTITGSGNGTVSIPLDTLSAGVYTFTLTGIVSAGPDSACGPGDVLATNTLTVRINPTPDANIVEDTITICANDDTETLTIEVENTQYCPNPGGALTFAPRTMTFIDNISSSISSPLVATGATTSAVINIDSSLTAGSYTFIVETISSLTALPGASSCETTVNDTLIVDVIGVPELANIAHPDTGCSGFPYQVTYDITGVSGTQGWMFTYDWNNNPGDADTVMGTGPVTGATFALDPINFADAADTIRFTSVVTTTGFDCGSALVAAELPFYIFANPDVTALSVVNPICSGDQATVNYTTTNTKGRDWTIFYTIDTLAYSYSGSGDVMSSFTTPAVFSGKTDATQDTLVVAIDSIMWDNFPMCYSEPVTASQDTVFVNPSPMIDITSDSAICEGNQLEVTYTITNVPSPNTWDFDWATTAPVGSNSENGGPYMGTFNTGVLTPSGMTDVRITDLTNTTTGCSALPSGLDTIYDVFILSNDVVADWIPANGQKFCYSETDTWTDTFSISGTFGRDWRAIVKESGNSGTTNRTITGTGDGNFAYTTLPGTMTENFTVEFDTIYVVYDNIECFNIQGNPASIDVDIIPQATASISSLPTEVCSGETVSFSISVAGVPALNGWTAYYTVDGTSGSITGSGSGVVNITSVNPVTAGMISLDSIVNTSQNTSASANCIWDIDVDTTITVNPLTVGGTTSADASVCVGDNAGVIELDGETGSVVNWEFSTNGGTTWTDIAGTDTFISYVNLATTTQYRAVVQSGACAEATSSVTTISTVPLAEAEFVAAGPSTECAGTDITLDFTTTNVTGGYTLYYEVNGTPDSTTGTHIHIDSVVANTTVTITGIAPDAGAGCPNLNLNDVYTINVTDNPTATITSAVSPICEGSSSDVTINVDDVLTGEQWRVTYTVNGVTTTSSANFGPGSFTLNSGVLTSDATFYLNSIENVTSGCSSTLTDSVEITVDPATVGGTTSADASVCFGDNAGVIELDGETGAVVNWEYSTNGGTTWTDIAGTDTFISFTNLTVETQYRAIVQSGTCMEMASSATTISITPLPTAEWTNAGPSTVCVGTDVSLDVTIGNVTGAYTITYEVNGTQFTTNASTITLDSVVAATTVTITGIAETNGCEDLTLNDVYTINVNPLPVVSVTASSDTICQGSTGTVTINVDNVAAGQGWTLVYNEGTTTGNTKAGVGSGSFTITTAALSAGTVDVVFTSLLNTTTNCSGTADTTISIVVSPTSEGGITAGAATVCSGDNNGAITLSGETGDVAQWEYSTDGGNTWNVTSNTGNTITYSNITETTVYRALVISGACSGDYSTSTTITVTPLPEVSISGAPEVCPNEPAVFTLVVSNVGAGEAWVLTYNENGNVRTRSGIGSGTFTLTTNGYPESAGTIQVLLNQIVANCTNDELNGAATAIINPAPVASFDVENACQDSMVMFNNTSSISGGAIASYKWFFGDGDSSQAVSPSHAYASAGTYTVTLTAVSDNGCTNATTEQVTIFDTPEADFTFDNVCQNEVFSPMDASNIANGTIVSRTWNFGDNSPEVTGTNPTYSYASSGNYTVTLTVTSNNGCTNSISKDVTIYVLPDADFAANPVCEDEEMSFTNGTAVAYGTVNYEWTFGNQGSSTDVNPDFTFTGFGDFNVKLVATTNNGCQDSVTNVVSVWPKPEASFTVADVCLGEASNFVNSSTIAQGSIDENFWSFGDGGSASVDNPAYTYSNANETGYTVTLRAVSDKGCADIVTGSAIVWPLPEVNITADFREICDGDSAELTANVDQNTTSFLWNTEEVTQSIFAKQEGWYSVTVVGDPARGGCVGTDSIFITVWDNPVADAGNDTTIDLGSFAQLNGTGGLVYTWSPTTYLNNPDIANPIASDVREDIEYILTVTDENGCIDDDSVLVTVIDRFNLIVYNTVTPNGDGDNDVWNIDNIQAYPDAEVTVINRYGMEVFNTTDYANNLWDGTFDGKELPDGAYYYIITLPGNDDAEPFTGSINLIRNR